MKNQKVTQQKGRQKTQPNLKNASNILDKKDQDSVHSSLGLPSESYHENLSDKEIFSNDGDYHPNHGSPKKQNHVNLNKNFELSFEKKSEVTNKKARNNKNYDTTNDIQALSPEFQSQNRPNDQDRTTSTANPQIQGNQDLKQSTLKSLLQNQNKHYNKQNGFEQLSQKAKIIHQNVFNTNDKGQKQNQNVGQKYHSSISNALNIHPQSSKAQSPSFPNEFQSTNDVKFNNKKNEISTLFDESHISNTSAMNLLTNMNNATMDNTNTMIQNTSFNEGRIINNNYQNITNIRSLNGYPNSKIQGHLQVNYKANQVKPSNLYKTNKAETNRKPSVLNLTTLIDEVESSQKTENTYRINNKVMPQTVIHKEPNAKKRIEEMTRNSLHTRNFSAGEDFIKQSFVKSQRYDTNSEKSRNVRHPHNQLIRNQYSLNSNRLQFEFGDYNGSQLIDQDNWSCDESVLNKQIQMPNVYASRIELQQQIGLQLVRNNEFLYDKNTDRKIQHPQAAIDGFYKIVEKDKIDVINDYHDRCPCLNLRKSLMKMRVYIVRLANIIITNKLFETCSILVIVANSLFLALDDPLSSETPLYQSMADTIFQSLYTVEMVLKILAMGFIFNQGAYLRDAWNILDFIIIFTGYISLVFQGGGVNLSVLRSFRVIRPLRTISSIEGLRVIVSALVNSMHLLGDTILVLLFFFLIFAIAGVQLFSGNLKYRCMNIENGFKHTDDIICGGSSSCPPGYFCGKTNENPNYGSSNFDNIFFAFLNIFQTVTLEGWSDTMVQLSESVGTWVIIYFVPIVFIGAFFLLNLTLAVIKSKFTEEHNNKKNKKQAGKKKKPKLKFNNEETEEDDNPDQRPLTEEEKRYKQIEENKELTPKTKKQMKEKARIENLIKRLEVVIKHKEVHDRITPRESSVFSFSQGSIERSIPKTSNNINGGFGEFVNNNSKHNANTMLFGHTGKLGEHKFVKHHQHINYGDIFNMAGNFKFEAIQSQQYSLQHVFDTNINNDIYLHTGEYANSQTGLLINSQNKPLISELPKKYPTHRKAPSMNIIDFPINEEDQEEQDYNAHIDKEDEEKMKKFYNSDAKKKTQQNSQTASNENLNKSLTLQTKQAVSKWLGRVFEIEKQKADTRKNVEAKLLMGGFAGMKQYADSDQEQEIKKVKKAIYEKITENFNIFEFLDNEDEDEEGDDEMSSDEFEYDSSLDGFDSDKQGRHRINRTDNNDEDVDKVEVLDEEEEEENQGTPGKSRTIRKSTMATYETKSIIKKDNSNQQKTESEDVIVNGQSYSHFTTWMDNNSSSVVTKQQIIQKMQNKFLRLKTHSPSHNNIVEGEEPLEDENEERKRQQYLKRQETLKSKKQNKKKSAFKDNLVKFMKGCSVKKTSKDKRITSFKDEYMEMRRSKSQPKKIVEQKKKNTEMAKSAQTPIEFKKNMTVRAQSEDKRQKNLLQETKLFEKRDKFMKKRRSRFFAQAIKQIGKTTEQIQKEMDEKIHNKRFIKLGGGFELPKQYKDKKKLMRSGSFEHIKTPKDSSQAMSITIEDNNLERSPSLMMEEDFEKEVKKIKEEIQNKKPQKEEIPDMDEVLRRYKKKLIVRMKNYRFSSLNDVFQEREEKEIKVAQYKLNNQKPPELFASEKKKVVKPKPRTNIIGYQKKVFIGHKKFYEDLMINEQIESDDNQEAILERLEEEHNVDHRSNVYVTGTLSVVLNKPHAENKIMNKTYYKNLKEKDNKKKRTRAMPVILEEPRNVILFNKDDQNPRMSVYPQLNQLNITGPQSARGPRARSSVHYSQELLPAPVAPSSQPRNQQLLRRLNTRLSIVSALNSSRGFARRRAIFSRAGSQERKLSKMYGDTPESLFRTMRANIPRPIILTDNQILKRLNREVKQSAIFSQVNFEQLPDKIYRKDGTAGPTQKRKKKIKRKNIGDSVNHHIQHHKGEEGDDEQSSSSQEETRLEHDYYVDGQNDLSQQILRARKDAKGKHKDAVEWSGNDIMARLDPYKARIAIKNLSQIRVWPKGYYGYFKRWRVTLKRIMKSGIIENFMTLCVFANTVVLAIDHYGIEPSVADMLTNLNTFFTIVFAFEMFLKILAIGIVKWLRDKMNYMDGFIVILSLVELAFMDGKGALSALRAVRIFRTFRVLRVARLLRGMKSMMHIISVIQRSISSFIYLALLLLLFIFIYALLGMQIFGGQFSITKGSNRYNFDSFVNSFVTSFILLTVENWNTVLAYSFASDINQFISTIYFISCIFVGNFMLLNLFLAILLDAFTSVEEEDHETPEKKAAAQKKRIEDLKEKEGDEFVGALDDIQMDYMTSSTSIKKKKNKKRKKKKTEDNNILDESIEIDLEQLIIKQEQALNSKKELFQGVECERALYLFSKVKVFNILSIFQEHKLRKYIYRIVTSTKFEGFIMILIVGSSIKLIYDTYIQDLPEDNSSVQISAQFDIVFTVFFTLELMSKCLAYGFVMDKNSYLRESWNQLDCFIVTTSLIDVALVNVNIPVIKILRLLRILRPLRFISHNSSMKTLVIALIDSLGSIFNVGIVIVLVFMMFAILGVNLFAGKLQYCSIRTYEIDNKYECFKARGEWLTYDQNMDNVLKAMMTLFVVSNQEGWPDVMYTYTDITGIQTGPKEGNSAINAFFFIGFVFIGNFFFMNLFVGVLFMNFEKAQRDERESLLLDGEEMKWVDIMKMILNTKPEIIKTPKNKISQWVHKHTAPEGKFDMFIMICIILNMFQMALSFEGMSDDFSTALDYINYLFTSIFAIECILKIVGNGWTYFLPTWNKFDFGVVCASFLDIAMSQLQSTSLKFLRVGPQLARVLRVLRVSRLFRLLNKYRGLQALIQTITFSLPSLMNAFALLMLVYFIFSVLGVFWFREIKQGVIIDPIYMNFQNFSQALIILFRMSTGESWPVIMYDTMNTSPDCIPNYNCGSSSAPLFFFSYQLVCCYVMLNLFVLIILQQFELYYLPDDNIIGQFKDDLDNFKKCWHKYSGPFEGLKIKGLDLIVFFKNLKGDLGMSQLDDKQIMRSMVKMNIESDSEGFIFFNELLFKTMKRIYGQEKTKKKILADFEFKALEKLENIKKKMMQKSRKNERVKAVMVNPFLAVMYKNMSFKAWLKEYSKKQFYLKTDIELNLKRRNDEIEFNLDRESQDEEYHHMINSDYEYVTENDESVMSDDESSLEQQSGPDQQINSVSQEGPISRRILSQQIVITETQLDFENTRQLHIREEDQILNEQRDDNDISGLQ